MRKFAIFLVSALVLALAATAYAAQSNTYDVNGSTSPTNAGSKKKPKAIGIKFGFEVSEAAGQRPAVVDSYAITFAGTRVNSKVADTCSAGRLEAEGLDACPSKSLVGTGFIENQTGNRADTNDRSIECNVALTVVNHGKNKASIYVQGSPTETDRRRHCEIELAAPIPATFKNTKKGSTLTFTVPSSLKHPLPTLDNAVVKVTSEIKRITKGGKGFYESVGGCKKGKRTISVKFTTEAGTSTTSSTKARCKK